MGSEELLIKRIEGDIRGLKLGTKTLEQVDVVGRLARLKKTNAPMADDLEQRYLNVIRKKEPSNKTI